MPPSPKTGKVNFADVILFKPIKCEQSARLDMIKAQKEQLIKEGKWPPSP